MQLIQTFSMSLYNQKTGSTQYVLWRTVGTTSANVLMFLVKTCCSSGR